MKIVVCILLANQVILYYKYLKLAFRVYCHQGALENFLNLFKIIGDSGLIKEPVPTKETITKKASCI